MKGLWLLVALLQAPTGLRVPAEGVVYYVDAAASSAGIGSVTAPWRTLQQAFTGATPGSTVYIKAGTYTPGTPLAVTVSGTAGHGITFRNYASDVVILDATGIGTNPLIAMANQRYVTIQGLQIRNYTARQGIGIHITNGSDHIEIRDNTFSHFRMVAGNTAAVIANYTAIGYAAYMVAIRVTGNNGTIPNDQIILDGNTVTDIQEGWAETITVTGNSTNWQITNNRLFANEKSGIDAAGLFGESSVAATDQARSGVIRGNVISDSGIYLSGIYIDGGRDIVVERNLLYNMATWGVSISSENPAGNPLATSGIVVRDNVIYSNAYGISVNNDGTAGHTADSFILNNTIVCANAGIALYRNADRITFKNNLIACGNPIYSSATANASHTGDYNFFDTTGPLTFTWRGTTYATLAAYRAASGMDAHAVAGSPGFVNAAAHDYRLRVGSPAINAGDPAFVLGAGETDFAGLVRVMGRVEIGAHEYAP